MACLGTAIVAALEVADVWLLTGVRQLVGFQVACHGTAEVTALEVGFCLFGVRIPTVHSHTLDRALKEQPQEHSQSIPTTFHQCCLLTRNEFGLVQISWDEFGSAWICLDELGSNRISSAYQFCLVTSMQLEELEPT